MAKYSRSGDEIYSSYESIPEIGQGSYTDRWTKLKRDKFTLHSDDDFQQFQSATVSKENQKQSSSLEDLEARASGRSGSQYQVFNCAHSAMQGKRPSMEDAFAVEKYHQYNLYAVFDGHGGAEGSRIVADKMFAFFAKEADSLRCIKSKELKKNKKSQSTVPSIPTSIITFTNEEISRLINETLVKTDDHLYEILDGDDATNGTTVIWLIINTETKALHIANLGDSRCVVTQNKNKIFMTQDHKPNDELERARIYKFGGHVFMDRVNGDLALSRALGDFNLKARPFKGFNKTYNGYLPKIPKVNRLTGDLVSIEPDITHLKNLVDYDIADGPLKILLACDGVFDVYDDPHDKHPNQGAGANTTTDKDHLQYNDKFTYPITDLVSMIDTFIEDKKMQTFHYDITPAKTQKMMKRACRKIMHAAYDLSSVDNISVMLILV